VPLAGGQEGRRASHVDAEESLGVGGLLAAQAAGAQRLEIVVTKTLEAVERPF
jgi:hypothetical protein